MAGLFKFTVDVEDPSFEEEDVITGITLTANHILVIVDASSGAVKITLPSATSGTGKIDGEQTVVLNLQYAYVTIANDSGTVYIFKKIDSSGNSVTIDAIGSDEWHIIGGEYVKMEDLLGHLVDEQEEANKILQNIETHLRLGSDEELDKEED